MGKRVKHRKRKHQFGRVPSAATGRPPADKGHASKCASRCASAGHDSQTTLPHEYASSDVPLADAEQASPYEGRFRALVDIGGTPEELCLSEMASVTQGEKGVWSERKSPGKNIMGAGDKGKSAGDKGKSAGDKGKSAGDKVKGAENTAKSAGNKVKGAESKVKGAENKTKGDEQPFKILQKRQCDQSSTQDGHNNIEGQGNGSDVVALAAAAAAAGAAKSLSSTSDHRAATCGAISDQRGVRNQDLRHTKNAAGDGKARSTQTAREICDQLRSRPPDRLLAMFIGADGSLSDLLTSSALARDEPQLHDAVVDALGRILCTLFYTEQHQCLSALSAFLKSPIFCDSLSTSSALARLGRESVDKLLLALAVAVQEKLGFSDGVRACAEALADAAGVRPCAEALAGASAARPPLSWREAASGKAKELVRRLQGDSDDEKALERAAREGRCVGGAAAAAGADAAGYDYRSVGVLPSDGELRYGAKPQLAANKLDGGYASAREYVGTHFLLLREDFVGPLRSSVQEYMEHARAGRSVARLSQARLYSGATVVRREEGLCFELRLDPAAMGARRWSSGKVLLPGSLIVLTSDGCRKNVSLATVVAKRESPKGAPLLSVRVIRGFAQILGAVRNPSEDLKFTLIQSPSYYEGYVHNAEILQRMDCDRLPFRSYLVEGRDTQRPPAY